MNLLPHPSANLLSPALSRVALLCVLVFALSACNTTDEEVQNPKNNNKMNDNNTTVTTGNTTSTSNNSTTSMNNNTTSNTNTNTNTNMAGAPVPARQGCAAGGASSDGSVRGVHCMGPDNPSGHEATAGGVVWQPGATRVLAP